jgi:hypothetical protein
MYFYLLSPPQMATLHFSNGDLVMYKKGTNEYLYFKTCRYCIEGVCRRLADDSDSYSYDQPCVLPQTDVNSCGPPHHYKFYPEKAVSLKSIFNLKESKEKNIFHYLILLIPQLC